MLELVWMCVFNIYIYIYIKTVSRQYNKGLQNISIILFIALKKKLKKHFQELTILDLESN
jgi:hypothetical protein